MKIHCCPTNQVSSNESEIKEAILEGEIKNDYHEAYALMMSLGAELGLKVQV
ncbi:MAG: hypothetical protein U0T84_00615 [Chitinophagales bacterium]